MSSDFNLAYSSSERVFFSDEDEEARVAGARRPVVGFPRARLRDDATRPRLPRKTRASVETTEDIAREYAFARRDVTTMGASGPVDVSERRRTTRSRRRGFFERHEGVFVYVPNLIGYARIAATMYAFSVAFTSPRTCLLAYFAAFCCDELDGRFARRFNQCSEFGRAMDMVTDRLATCGLLMILAIEYPKWCMTCVALVSLDIASHWARVYVGALVGADGHKSLDDESSFWLLRLYYRNRIFMGACCVSVEVLFLCLHAKAADPTFRGFGPLDVDVSRVAAVPGFFVKQLANVAQLIGACRTLARVDVVEITSEDVDDE